MLNFESGFYEKLFKSLDTNAVLMRVEPDGNYSPIWCSEEFLKMIGGTESEFIQLESGGTMNSIHPDDRDEVAYLFHHHVTKSGTNSLNVRKLTIKGNWIWVNIHYSFACHDGTWYAYCNYFDITAIKENEQRAQNFYESVRTELENVSGESMISLRLNLTKNVVEKCKGKDLYIVDVAGTSIIENFNARLASFPLERDRKKFAERFHPDKLLESYRSGDISFAEILFNQRPNGRKCFVEYTVTISENPQNGDLIAFVLERDYNAEIVHNAILTKALVSQYDMITYLVDGYYGVVIGDASRITKGSIFPKKRTGNYNEYVERQVKPVLTGTDEEIQKNLDALRLETVEAKLSEREPYEVDIACHIRNEIFYKRFIFYLVDRAAKFYVLLKSDTTKIQREQIMRNNQLKAALDNANQASVAKTAFLSSMSHEIRTPMNAIIGLDSIALKEPNLPARTREHLRKIGDSARHLLVLINDILDMSRIESGRMVLKNEEFSFGDMMEQINTMVGGQCADKGLNYDCKIIGKVDDFYIGDVMKLKQALINILGNAVKFTPARGDITFTVERVAKFGNNSTLRFVVKDTGIGMDEEYLPRLFDVFSQEDSTTANAYGGTGLGMPITKSIVEMMNGNISVKSKKHVGAEFTVNVTLRNSDKVYTTQTSMLTPSDLNVLIIDDDPIACEHARLVLEEVGIAAEVAMSGAEALEMIKLRSARREAYNLMLIDLRMPNQNGIEVTREIRRLIGNESAIIILTAHHWDDVMEEALEAGVDKFMSKPLFASSVMTEFSEAIAQKRRDVKKLADLEGRHILIAEDMFINAEILKEILIMRDMEVDHGENGEEVVALFKKSPPNYYDAVLMDIRMPVMDGLQATEAIRALERPDAKTVPIIAMTANAFDEDVQRSLQAGMNAHLSKPVEPDHLYETLAELIK
ncbi:MAG: response regulator [Selenomonadaceae bacterium]|nr:response regulator [Selenomonadaceae bacterium]